MKQNSIRKIAYRINGHDVTPVEFEKRKAELDIPEHFFDEASMDKADTPDRPPQTGIRQIYKARDKVTKQNVEYVQQYFPDQRRTK